MALLLAAVGLLPLPSPQLRGRPSVMRKAVFACAGSAADQARHALQSGDAAQIEEAMAAIIDEERLAGRSEEEIPDSPLLEQLAEMQRRRNPDVFAAGSAAGASGSGAGGAAADLRQTAEPDAPPQAGEEAWGRWSHGAEGIELQIELAATPDGPVRAKSVRCEVVDGCLFAQVEGVPAPLLFGRFRHEVKAGELEWMIDESERGMESGGDDNARVLSLELPWKKTASELRGPGEAPGRIFDESLHVLGEPCLVAGLSVIAIVPQTQTTPQESAPEETAAPTPSDEVVDV